jgi:hypothetical protein
LWKEVSHVPSEDLWFSEEDKAWTSETLLPDAAAMRKKHLPGDVGQ